MRTKALLTMAALAAGAITAMADTSNVYSLNIVGYVNINVPGGNSLLANPLDNGAGNSASQVLNLAPLDDGGNQPDGTLSYITLSTYDGTSFHSFYYESDYTSNMYGPNFGNPVGPTNGWATDNTGARGVAAPVLLPGSGFFIANPSSPGLNTYVGTVVPAPGATNSMGIPGGNSLVASVLPVSGNLSSAAMQFPLSPLDDGGNQPDGTLSYITVSTYDGTSFHAFYYESDYTSNMYGPNFGNPVGPTNGWATDNTGARASAAPTVNVGSGFFISNPSSPGVWAQHL